MSTATRKGRGSAANAGGKNRLVIGLVAVAILAFVGVVAVLSAGEVSDIPTLDQVAARVDIDGDPIRIPYPESGPDPAEGLPSPVVTARDYSDQEFVIGAPGRAQVVVFLAHWCPVCDQELPTLRDAIVTGQVPDDVDLVFVTTGLNPGRPNWPPKRWLEDAGLGAVTTVRDDVGDPLMRTFGLGAYPAWAVIDADGTLLARRQGLLRAPQVAELFTLASS